MKIYVTKIRSNKSMCYSDFVLVYLMTLSKFPLIFVVSSHTQENFSIQL